VRRRRRERAVWGMVPLLGPVVLGAAILWGCTGCGEGRGSGRLPGPIQVVGESGTGPGQFFYPRSVAVDPQGGFCVVDRSGRIQRFAADGTFLLSFELPAFQAGQPTGINFARSGELLVADSHYNRVLVYGAPETPGGPPRIVRSFGSEGAGDGQFSLVRDIVEDSKGFLYVGDYDGPEDRIEKFTAEGRFLQAWGRRGTGPGEFQRPQGLCIERRRDGAEYLLAADSCNHRIQRFTLDGSFVDAFGSLGSGPGELKYPYALAAFPPEAPGAPAILVAEWGNNRIQCLDPAGRPLAVWGGPGRETGELSTPWDVALGPDGRIFVADFGNHRIQIFKPHSTVRPDSTFRPDSTVRPERAGG